MESFTPISALVGGALIGVSASLLMLSHGRIAGISDIFAGLFDPASARAPFRVPFLAGLFLAGLCARFVYPSVLPADTSSLAIAAIAGVLVGFGARLGSGCTSGHGVCGLSRLSKRSLVATITFMATGIATVAIARALRGGS